MRLDHNKIVVYSGSMQSFEVILNEREAREARAKIAGLDEALSSDRSLAPMVAGLPPEVVTSVSRALKAERRELHASVAAYEAAMREGEYAQLRERIGSDPGLALIVARIAKGLTQKDLAWRLGVKEQQVQRYEADRYRSISLSNYGKIAALLGVELKAMISNLQGRDRVVDDVTHGDMKKILKHGRENGWFAEGSDEQDLRRFVAENRIAYGSPALLRTGLNVRDHSGDLLLHAWRARVSMRASDIIASYKPRYDPLYLTWLRDLVQLSAHDDGPAQAREMLLKHGIVLVAELPIQGLAVDGAAFVVDSVPVIGLTLRKDAVDNFWFTLMHELAHVILHYRTGLQVGFFDETDAATLDEQEAEANAFAANMLIPEERWRRSPARISKTTAIVEKFANEIGIHPAIVFGRIRKERSDYSIFSDKVGGRNVRHLLLNES